MKDLFRPIFVLLSLFLAGCDSGKQDIFDLSGKDVPLFEIGEAEDISFDGQFPKPFMYSVVAPVETAEEDLSLFAKSVLNAADPHDFVIIFFYASQEDLALEKPFGKAHWGSKGGGEPDGRDYTDYVLSIDIYEVEVEVDSN